MKWLDDYYAKQVKAKSPLGELLGKQNLLELLDRQASDMDPGITGIWTLIPSTCVVESEYYSILPGSNICQAVIFSD